MRRFEKKHKMSMSLILQAIQQSSQTSHQSNQASPNVVLPPPNTPKLKIHVTSNVDAAVLIDGSGSGRFPTPHTFELSPDKYKILVTKKRHYNALIPINLEDRDVRIDVEMGRNRKVAGGILAGIAGGITLPFGIYSLAFYDIDDGFVYAGVGFMAATVALAVTGLVLIISSKKTKYKVSYQ